MQEIWNPAAPVHLVKTADPVLAVADVTDPTDKSLVEAKDEGSSAPVNLRVSSVFIHPSSVSFSQHGFTGF